MDTAASYASRDATGRVARLIGLLFLACSSLAFAAGRNRPQTPEPPFPYRSEEVTFAGSGGSVRLAGTLTLPPGQGPFPAVYLIPGASPFDRDESLAGHKPFMVLADHLTRHGIAVLRVDDRGVGGSSGQKMNASIDELVDDVVSGVALLADRQDIDRNKIGLVGHSQGAILAPIVASRSEQVAFVVLLAGNGKNWMQYLAMAHAADGEGTVEVNRRIAARAVELLNGEGGPDLSLADLHREWEAQMRDWSEAEQAEAKEFVQAMKGLGMFLRFPTTRAILAYDPEPVLRGLRCSVLAITGGVDPGAITLPSMEAALRQGGNEDFACRRLPNLNHMLQTVKEEDMEDGPALWARIEETISPVALEVISGWIVERTGG